MRFTINYTTRATQITETGVKPVRVAVNIKTAGSCYGTSLIERAKELAMKHDFAMLHRGERLMKAFKRVGA